MSVEADLREAEIIFTISLPQKHVWGQEMVCNSGPTSEEVAGATLGLVGVGSIGRRVAEMANAIGMRVIAVREHVEKGTPEGIEKVFPPTQIDELLRQSGFVVIAAPLIPATEKLINASRLRVMKPAAYLLNVGRGPQVDESGLFDALRAHRIAGAALDVFEHEPLPADSPCGISIIFLSPRTPQGSPTSFGIDITSTFQRICAATSGRNPCNTLSINAKDIDPRAC